MKTETSGLEGAPKGYLAMPKKGSGPGVLVLHAWWGLNDVFTSVCDRLAAAGFAAFAPDLYHGAIASTIEEAKTLLSRLDEERAREDVVNSVRALRHHPKVRGDGLGVVGFSMGASWALWSADEFPGDVAAVVVFYGTSDKPARARAAFLGHFAEKDEWESTEYINELEGSLRAAGREVAFHTYPGTTHWFFEGNRPDAYDAEAARIAWQRTVTFLTTHLFPKKS